MLTPRDIDRFNQLFSDDLLPIINKHAVKINEIFNSNPELNARMENRYKEIVAKREIEEVSGENIIELPSVTRYLFSLDETTEILWDYFDDITLAVIDGDIIQNPTTINDEGRISCNYLVKNMENLSYELQSELKLIFEGENHIC